MKLCSIPECGKRVHAKRLCSAHYCRLKRNGDPLGGSTSPGEPMRFVLEVAAKYELDDCLTWPFHRNPEGYGYLKVGSKRWFANRYICQLVHGEPPTPEHQSAHSCGNGHLGCVNPKHLRWATLQGNMDDMVAHGRSKRGSSNNTTRLTEEQVREILALRGEKRPMREIAEQFGVSRSAVDHILKGRNWYWLEPSPTSKGARAR